MSVPPQPSSPDTFGDAREADWDTVSSGRAAADSARRREATWLSHNAAHILDRLFPVRGSSARFGIDPILGLVPGVGDAIAAALGGVIVLEALRLGAPRATVLRMIGNIAINGAVGAIPLIGDIFSFLFQSNARNYALLRSWQTGERTVPAGVSGPWLAAGCMALIVIAAGLVALAAWLVSVLWKWLAH